jgi:hypothetical protein
LSCHGCSVAERSRPICPVLATRSQFRKPREIPFAQKPVKSKT